jgi:hypothetical protein
MEDFIRAQGQHRPAAVQLPARHRACTWMRCCHRTAVRLRAGLKAFGEKMRGYLTNEAVLVAVEAAPAPRCASPATGRPCSTRKWQGLYPCGEGGRLCRWHRERRHGRQRVADAVAHRTNFHTAWPRWLTAFFILASSSAKVRSLISGRKTGS